MVYTWPLDIRPMVTPEDEAAFLDLASTYFRWHIVDLGKTLGLAIDPEPLIAEMHARVAQFRPPRGHAFIAARTGTPAGIVGVRWHGPDTAEIKRLYVAPAARGLGLARALVETAVEAAKTAGRKTLLLDTFKTMVEAQRLYRRLGFVERDAYPQSEVDEHIRQHFLFFERRL